MCVLRITFFVAPQSRILRFGLELSDEHWYKWRINFYISNKVSAMYRHTVQGSVRWRHMWHVTLAIHFNMPSLALQYQQQYCIRHMTPYDPMVFKWWPAVSDIGLTLKQPRLNFSCLLRTAPGINSRPNMATLTKCWASVVDGVPALKQHWLHVIVQRYACLLGQSVPEAYTATLSWHKETLNLSTIYDFGPTLSQLWFDVLSLLACQYTCIRPI